MHEVREVSAARLERPTICALSLSAIADDPRVRRQAEAFHRAGWNVVAVGLPGARSAEPEWRILTRANLLAPAVVTISASPPTGTPSPPLDPSLHLRLRQRVEHRLLCQFRSASMLLPGLTSHQRSALERSARS